VKLPTHPLQTQFWANFRSAWGNEVIKSKYGYLTLHKLPLINKKIGMFIRGPKPTTAMLTDMKKLARDQNLIFIKLEPFTLRNKKLISLFKRNGAIPGRTLFTPTTFWIDLTKSDDDLMSSFTSKTRYNIRLAEKKGVKIKIDNSDKAFNEYLRLTKETVERQGFYAHSERYHHLMWQYLKDNLATLITATYKNEVITAWVLFKYKNFLYYPYGASSAKHKNVMANNLVLWEAIKYGKSLGCTTFDLWGREEGKGFTRFKEGYNPQVIDFIGTWDLITNKPVYYLYRLLDFFRWHLLRLKSRFIKPRF